MFVVIKRTSDLDCDIVVIIFCKLSQQVKHSYLGTRRFTVRFNYLVDWYGQWPGMGVQSDIEGHQEDRCVGKTQLTQTEPDPKM